MTRDKPLLKLDGNCGRGSVSAKPYAQDASKLQPHATNMMTKRLGDLKVRWRPGLQKNFRCFSTCQEPRSGLANRSCSRMKPWHSGLRVPRLMLNAVIHSKSTILTSPSRVEPFRIVSFLNLVVQRSLRFTCCDMTRKCEPFSASLEASSYLALLIDMGVIVPRTMTASSPRSYSAADSRPAVRV